MHGTGCWVVDAVRSGIIAANIRPTIPAGVTLAHDDFNRPNSTSGLGVAPTGQAWTQHGTGIVGIIDGHAYRASNLAFASLDVGAVDMKVTSTVAVSGAYFAGPLARISPDGQFFYFIEPSTGGFRLKRFIEGAETLVPGSTYVPVPTAPYTLSIVCRDEPGEGATTVEMWVNGELRQTISDSLPERPMGTRAGLRPFNNANIRIDDFLVESA